MPNQNLVEVVCVIDRSGSMATIKNDAEGGFNTFISKLKEDIVDKDLRLTLVEFDSVIETVYESIPFEKVEKYELTPRGSTALLDAMGSTINKVGYRLSKEKEENRPGRIIFMTLTDGEENSSHEYTKEKIKNMIEHQESKYSWEFLFLSSDLNSYDDAQKYNFGGSKNCSYNFSATGGINGVSGYSGMTGYVGLYSVVAENISRSINNNVTLNIIDKDDSSS